MKLNWFSPLPPAQSDIANYALRVLPILSAQAEVVIWTDQPEWDSQVEEYGLVKPYDFNNIPWPTVHQADLNIYHIGNNPLFHGNIWQISQHCTGLVILHDSKLQDFFNILYQETGQGQSYLWEMKRFYGVEGEKATHNFWNGIVSISWLAENYPLTPLALKNSIAAITHNQRVYRELQQEYSQLSGYIPLAYEKKLQLSPPEKPSRNSLPYQLIIFGHIGKNRRLEKVLDALATYPQKNSFKLDIYGELWDETYIKQYISQLNLEEQVSVKGFVPEEALETALAQADLAINLRYPSMGEASGSQLRIWSHALPSLVTQTDWYAELPQDTVAYIRPDYEIEDIQQHFSAFIQNPDLYREMGKKGQQYLEAEHDPQIYVQSLLDIATQACSLRHRSLIDYLSDRVGKEVSYWQIRDNSPIVTHKVVENLSFFLDGKLRITEPLAPNNSKISSQKAIKSRYTSVFQGYEFYQGEWVDYVETHLPRYLATLELIPKRESLHILELGSSYAFSLILKQHFPDATIILAENPETIQEWPGVKRITNIDQRGDNNQIIQIEFTSILQNKQNQRFSCAQFNIEKDPWPFADNSFDVVLSMEILQHLLLDPCFSFREANRVLKNEGTLILTTPNIARYESVASILRGSSPYTFGIYSQKYSPYGRHNREYVPREVVRLGECSGFQTDLIVTQDVYPLSMDIQPVKELLTQNQDDPEMRGQTIFYRGIKISDKFDSYPLELYG